MKKRKLPSLPKREESAKKKEEKPETKKDKGRKEEKKEHKRGFRRFDLEKFGSKRMIILGFIFSLVFSSGFLILFRSILGSLISFAALFGLIFAYAVIKRKLKRAAEIGKMEDVFPDFIGLMASNLRAGMTIDRALLLSSRKEFAPLDKEISLLGKDIVTGKEITRAMQDASKRIGSPKIERTIKLIISGIRSGGNLAVLLEETSENMRERGFVEKRAASNVLMYVIFIFFAIAVGAPLLFGLSSVLVEVLTQLVGQLPTEQVVTNAPFALTQVSISTTFITYFSVVFLVVMAVLASFVLGLVSKGKEREGLKYVLPLIFLGLAVFFASRLLLLRYFSDLFA